MSRITAARLVELERRFGGRVRHDAFVGGDRMEGHGYAPAYAAALNAFVGRHGPPATVVEIGVLRGTGLALWAEVFPAATVLGLDRDLAPFEAHRPALVEAGADLDRVRTAVADQAQLTPERVAELLAGLAAPALVTDDASHIDALTLRTLDAVLPHLAAHALYFVEDQPRASDIHRTLAREPRGLRARRVHRYLTELSR